MMDAGATISDFIASMEAAGVRPAEPIAARLASGELIRFRCGDDKRPNAWAKLNLDGRPVGAFGWHRAGINERWTAAGTEPMSDVERRRLRQEWRETSRRREVERQAAKEAAAVAAVERWQAARPADPAHAYLKRKGLAGEGLRQEGTRLLVPMRDVAGRLWSLQTIAPDGFKQFLRGGRPGGLLCILGGGGTRALIGEGYATMAAVRAATSLPAIVAFSGENLMAAAKAVRARWPWLELVVCADDDAHLVDHPQIGRNLGLEYARAAAAEVGGLVALPRTTSRKSGDILVVGERHKVKSPERFKRSRHPRRRDVSAAEFPGAGKFEQRRNLPAPGGSERGQDFDDFARRYGAEAVREAIAHAEEVG